MSEMEWSSEAVIMMVKAYEKRQELWKRDHTLYRVQSAKHAAWRAIGRLFSCDTPDLRKKFNSLLASHRRERIKEKYGGKSNWFLYPHFKFLRPGDDDQEETPNDIFDIGTIDHTTIGNLVDSMSDDTEAGDLEQELEADIIIKDEPDSVQAFTHKEFNHNGIHGKRRLMRTLKPRPKRQSSEKEMYSKAYIDRRILELQRKMRKESIVNKDECDTYGEYIASMLRKRDIQTRCLIKHAINNILYEQEMNEYENPLGNDIMITEALDQSDECDDN